MFLHRLEQAVRHVLRDVSVGNPSHLSYLLDGRDVGVSTLHFTGGIGDQTARHGVNPLTKQLHRSHVQSCLLTGLPHSGFLSRLTRLNLAGRELPGELAPPTRRRTMRTRPSWTITAAATLGTFTMLCVITFTLHGRHDFHHRRVGESPRSAEGK